jgi:hypothetical protein
MYKDATKAILVVDDEESAPTSVDGKQLVFRKTTVKKAYVHTTLDQKLEVLAVFCELYKRGEYTFDSCAQAAGVSSQTIRTWVRPRFNYRVVPESSYPVGFHPILQDFYFKAVQESEDLYFEKLKESARGSILRRVEGYEYEESSSKISYDADGNSKPLEVKTTKKHVPPDASILIFVAKSVDSDNFKDSTEVTHHVGEVKNKLKNLSDVELSDLEKELEQKLLE